MEDHNFQPHELTPEYLLARINILTDAVVHLAGLAAAYMPPDGQDFVGELFRKLDEAENELAVMSKEALEAEEGV